MNIIRLLILAVGLLAILHVEAANAGAPQVAGSGCSASNVSMALTQNQTLMTLSLDGFAVEAGRSFGRRLDRKACQISLPVSVPEGYQVSVSAVSYKGYTSVPAGGMARVEIETFMGGDKGLHTERVFSSPFDNSHLSGLSASQEDLQWSACGQNFDMKVKTAMLVQSNNRMDSVSTVMNGSDPNAKINFNLQWRKCSKT